MITIISKLIQIIQDVAVGVQYKVNVYAIVEESEENVIESKELHEKVSFIFWLGITNNHDLGYPGRGQLVPVYRGVG